MADQMEAGAGQTGPVNSHEQLFQLLQQQHAEMASLRARLENQEAQAIQNSSTDGSSPPESCFNHLNP